MEFKILTSEWEVIKTRDYDKTTMSTGEAVYGLCAYREKKIYLNEVECGTKSQLLSTFRHELAHAFLHECMLVSTEWFNEEELCGFVGAYCESIENLAREYKECLR